ncbi:MAG TPA: chorismate-binding protein [Acidiferrobacter sp.]|nr:chorismate-binding protein [Acidiferrobacter sp.]
MKEQATVRPASATIADLLDVHECFPDHYPHLLSSAANAGGRYDILFAYPEGLLILEADATVDDCAHFFRVLDATVATPGRSPKTQPALPFHYGHFLYLSYELIAGIEPRLCLPRADAIPLAWVQGFGGAVLRDHKTQTTYITARAGPIADAIEEDLRQTLHKARAEARDALVMEWVREDEPCEYLEGVRAIQDYIVAGDIFQANLSRGYQARVGAGTKASSIMRALKTHNPAPFSALAQIGSTAILSASPERLMRVQGDQIRTYPIAGTIARAADPDGDQAAKRVLRDHPKEQAEHIMLVDLERNDLGRLCRPGTVRVEKLMTVESYATVHHLVSEIQGTLRPHTALSAIIASLFPGGSITGCPKLRSIEILAELEQGPRGAYTGSLGYVSEAGNVDLNILIRTILMTDQQLTWRVGAGIVADSEPARELAETRAKAAGLLRSLGL